MGMTWLLLFGVALFGQDPTPMTGPAAAWTGTGLLGGVLAWLLFWHLPEKDKQAKEAQQAKDAQIGALIKSHDDQVTELLEKKDAQIDQQRAEFTLTLTNMMVGFRSESTAERVACEKHFESLSSSMTAAFKTLADQLAHQAREAAAHSARNQQWIDLLKKEVEERKAALAQKGGGS